MRDWSAYNKSLIKRGEILFSFDFLQTWDKELERMNKRKTSRHYAYPNSFILILSYIRAFFHLPYRQTEGLMKAIGKELLGSPSYSQMNRRINQLDLKIEYKSKEGEKEEVDEDYLVIAIDSTGIKITNRGQWMRDKWKVSKKGYLKIHLAVNIKTKKILSFEVTDEKVHDSRIMCRLISNIQAKNTGKIKGVFADGAYDTNANFLYLSSRQIQPMIRVRRNAIICKRNCNSRNKAVLLQRQRDWKKEMDYGKRWIAERNCLFYIQEDVW
jgi:hypothetical protein